METKIEDFGINVGCGRSAAVIIKESFYVTIRFSNDHPNMSEVDLSKHPELIIKALSEIKKRYPDAEPTCQLYQASDWVMYHYKRIR